MTLKPSAAELFGKLQPSLGDDEARTIVKGKIDKGELTDDLGVAPVISQAQLTDLIEGFKKAFDPAAQPPAAQLAPVRGAKLTKITKGATSFVGNEADGVDLSGVENGIDELGSRFDNAATKQDFHYAQIVKGLEYTATITKGAFVALAEIDRRNVDLTNEVAALRKAMESMAKGGPKAVTGNLAVVPTLAEQGGTQGAQAAAVAANAVVATTNVEAELFEKANAFIDEQLVKAGVSDDRKMELRHAQAQMFSGLLPSQINKDYKLGLS